jgi:hypothetical protein
MGKRSASCNSSAHPPALSRGFQDGHMLLARTLAFSGKCPKANYCRRGAVTSLPQVRRVGSHDGKLPGEQATIEAAESRSQAI